jgi:ABC-2 type transport system ATP-binding protein
MDTMPLIEVNQVRKVFETNVRRKGRFGTLISLIRPEKREVAAVEGISFSIRNRERKGMVWKVYGRL